MLSVIISVGLGAILGLAIFDYTVNPLWAILSGASLFIILQISLGLIIRRIVKKRTRKVESIILNGQEKLNRKVLFFQQKPVGGMKNMQKLLEKEMHVFIREALDATKELEPLYCWNILLKKQVNTMRMQFYYQLKEFDRVDELIPKAMYVEPMSVAMKMARQYKNDNSAYKKTFRKKVRKFKGEKGVILYATYSWILVKTGQTEEAIKVLLKGKSVTGDETIAKNWEHLVNGRTKKFSNANLGDEWYSLFLEEPKFAKPKQKVVRRQRF